MFDMAHQSGGNSTATSVRRNRDVVHIDAGSRGCKRSLRPCDAPRGPTGGDAADDKRSYPR
jgi:hypothetical protein